MWGGLFPSDVETNFADVITMIFNDSDCWRHWCVGISMSIFIPSVFMMIMSCIGQKGLFIVADVVGIILWFKQILSYGAEDDGFEDLVDFEDGCISIGTWIAIALFIIAFLIVISIRNNADKKRLLPTTKYLINSNCDNNCLSYETQSETADNKEFKQNAFSDSSANAVKFCPNCGTNINNRINFCGKCGYKL